MGVFLRVWKLLKMESLQERKMCLSAGVRTVRGATLGMIPHDGRFVNW
jgi:hypothetical protein